MSCGFCYEYEFAKNNFEKYTSDTNIKNTTQELAVKLIERRYQNGRRIVAYFDGMLHQLSYCPECGKKLENV